MTYPANDTEFEDFILTEVTRHANSWSVGFDGYGFGFDAKEGINPKVGSVMRQYGRGFGFPVRGCFIDGQEVYYRTVEQEEAHREAEWQRRKQEKRDALERERSEREARFNALPPEFQARIVRFRRNNDEFQAEHEPYEVFCCREAIKIAMALGTGAKIREFHNADSAKQKELVPTLEYDQHSGNTFAAAVRLAWLYMEKPELVAREHGALCPLTGCLAYGCVAPDAPDAVEYA